MSLDRHGDELPTVSIALATYNGARFLRQQLDSLDAQELLPKELVVTDDASSDATADIVARFAETARFPVYFHRNETRLGWRANFFRAMSLCKGDTIALCDQDDVWYPTKLKVMAGVLADPEVLLAHHGADLIDEDGQRRGVMQQAFRESTTRAQSRHSNWPNPFGLTMVFRRRLLRYVDLWADPACFYAPDKPFPHDQWLFNFAINLGTVKMDRNASRRLPAARRQRGRLVREFVQDERARLRSDRREGRRRVADPSAIRSCFRPCQCPRRNGRSEKTDCSSGTSFATRRAHDDASSAAHQSRCTGESRR